MNVMKIFFSHAALLCGAVLSMPVAIAAGVPVHVLAPNSCWMPERSKVEQQAGQQDEDDQRDEQRSRQRNNLLLRECGLVDSDKDVDEHLNDGISVKDPWKKADDMIEFSRQYNAGDAHQSLGPGAHQLRLGDKQHALPDGSVPAVPEPSGYLMLGAGLLLLGGRSWHRRRRATATTATAN